MGRNVNPEKDKPIESLKELQELMAEAGFPDAFAYELADMQLHPEQFQKDIERIRDELIKRSKQNEK